MPRRFRKKRGTKDLRTRGCRFPRSPRKSTFSLIDAINVGFDARHERFELLIVADLAAAEEAATGTRQREGRRGTEESRRARDLRGAAVCDCISGVQADIKTCPDFDYADGSLATRVTFATNTIRVQWERTLLKPRPIDSRFRARGS